METAEESKAPWHLWAALQLFLWYARRMRAAGVLD